MLHLIFVLQNHLRHKNTNLLKKTKNIVFVVGRFYPDINGAVRQAELLANRLKRSRLARVYVLSGIADRTMDRVSLLGRLPVLRSNYDATSALGRIIQIFIFLRLGFFLGLKADLIHFHGFSRRNALLFLLMRVLGRPCILKMTLLGVDDPLTVRRLGWLWWLIYKEFDHYIGITPAFTRSFGKSGLPLNRYSLIPNGVDFSLFHPLTGPERDCRRLELGLPVNAKIFLSVGNFSTIKNMFFVYKVWLQLWERGCQSYMVFIGNFEGGDQVDPLEYRKICDDAKNHNLEKNLLFIGQTDKIHEYLACSNYYISGSTAEGLSNALLEALATGLVCFTTSLEGNTTWLCEKTKLIFPINSLDEEVWARFIIMTTAAEVKGLIPSSLEEFKREFDIDVTEQRIHECYLSLIN